MSTSRATDLKFLETAREVARIWSKDGSTKVAAVAVGELRSQVAWGYNGFPPGIEDSPERIADRTTKLSLTLHAEVNALANAKFDVRTLYVTHPPCCNCALHILSRRTVQRVVYQVSDDLDMARWGESLAQARALLAEGGVLLEGVAP
jgi:dCMP deaminase